jgi:hypothetical protein
MLCRGSDRFPADHGHDLGDGDAAGTRRTDLNPDCAARGAVVLVVTGPSQAGAAKETVWKRGLYRHESHGQTNLAVRIVVAVLGIRHLLGVVPLMVLIAQRNGWTHCSRTTGTSGGPGSRGEVARWVA